MELSRLPNGRVNTEAIVVDRFYTHLASLALPTAHSTEVNPIPADESNYNSIKAVETDEPQQKPL